MAGLRRIWKDEMEETIIVNAYSPCNMAGKRAFWEELLDLKNR